MHIIEADVVVLGGVILHKLHSIVSAAGTGTGGSSVATNVDDGILLMQPPAATASNGTCNNNNDAPIIKADDDEIKQSVYKNATNSNSRPIRCDNSVQRARDRWCGLLMHERIAARQRRQQQQQQQVVE